MAYGTNCLARFYVFLLLTELTALLDFMYFYCLRKLTALPDLMYFINVTHWDPNVYTASVDSIR